MRTDKGKAESKHSVGKEYCVLCGGLTGATKEQPLSKREYYIEGAGQLCRKCYQELYVPQHNKNVVRLANQHMLIGFHNPYTYFGDRIQFKQGGKRWKG